MDNKRFFYLIGVVTLCSWFLYFIMYFNAYTLDEIISGIAFILVASTIFFIFVYLYFDYESGEKATLYGLFVIGIMLLFVWVNFDSLQTLFPEIFGPKNLQKQ